MDHEKLHNLLLTSDNWELLEELERLLSVCGLWFVVTGMLSLHKSQIFTEVTRTMSMARTPTLPWALPMYEHMRVELVDAIDLTNEPTIKAAAQAGLTKLMQYYDKALQNESNIVAQVSGLICSMSLNLTIFSVPSCSAPQLVQLPSR